MESLKINHEKKYKFSHLPTELVVKIFTYLSNEDLAKRICLVNRQFRDISYTPSLWTQLNFVFNISDSVTASSLFNRCKMLQKLELNHEDAAPLAIKALHVCHQLNSLSIHVNDSSILPLLKALKTFESLRELTMNGNWNIKWFSEQADCLHRLIVLNLPSSTTVLEGKGLIEIGKHCKRIKVFRTNAALVDDGSMMSFLAAVKDTIQDLTLTFSEIRTDMLAKCKHLKSLSICVTTPDALQSISILPELQRLSMPCWNLYNDQFVKSVDYVQAFSCKKLHKLNRLDLSWQHVDDLVLQTVAGNCPELILLSLWRCGNVTDVGLIAIMEKCPKLQELKLYCVKTYTSAAFIRSDGVAASLSLIKLKVSYNSNTAGELAKIKKAMPKLDITMY